jgi:hypothetical protein
LHTLHTKVQRSTVARNRHQMNPVTLGDARIEEIIELDLGLVN